MKKHISIFLVTVIAIFAPMSIFASTTDTNNNTVPKESVKLLNPKDYNTSYDNAGTITPTSIPTKLVKKAIRVILRNKTTAVNIVEKLGGKRAAKAFEKGFSHVAPQLRQLLKWSDIPYQAVYDAVYRGMINSGASRATATKAALAIKEGLSWLI